MLIFLGKAELVAKSTTKILHTSRSTFPWPTVIRLNRYRKIPHKSIILSRKNIFKRDKHICGYCGRGDLPLTVDHIIPRARGGEDTWDNLISACLPCNNRKGDNTLEVAGLKLLTKPYKPNYIMFLTTSFGRIDSTWKPYLFQR
ncbi:MAG: HNH endonuclease [Bacteroidetes bacterium]|nr:HNH endonuclease [Bacteroidota bacterium]MBU1679835.1 HNH endonuclease [Bacteroidota bacterium]MBU2507935.1 HNH endonuclease [Bacteroidota bacterium]